MKIGIIGAGFTGLAAAYNLSKKDHKVTVFEAHDRPGGLAAGFKDKNWDWALEHHYHHLFTSDHAIQNLAREVDHQINYSRPKTSTLINGKILQLDSPLSLLSFSELPLLDRIRTGFVLAFLRVTPFWKPLERVTAKQFIIRWMGHRSWEILWEPLFTGKFHTFASQIPASWFWARIKKRSANLGYPKGGFLSLAKAIASKISEQGGSLHYNTTISEISDSSEGIRITTEGKLYTFDKVICTLPTPLFLKITKDLPQSYIKSIQPFKGIGLSLIHI